MTDYYLYKSDVRRLCQTYVFPFPLTKDFLINLPSNMVLIVTDCLVISTSTSNIFPALCNLSKGMVLSLKEMVGQRLIRVGWHQQTREEKGE